jgi:DNA-binding NarL/FixJ family response regulator/tetratricopeptide (TPR) repeat protein
VAEALLFEAVTPIGRQRQLDNLRNWVTELSSGQGHVALIEGEPGIGKSSLVRAAVAEAELAGCQVYWATCDELSEAFPLLPLLDSLDVHAPVGRVGGHRIAEMLRADPAPGNRVNLVAAAVERMLALVEEVCATGPTVLVVDDLQWADSATVMTVGRLARLVHQLPLLLVCINRPVPRRHDLGALRRAVEPDGLLQVGGLSDEEVVQFVASLVGGTPGNRLLRLAAGAAGNPLYLTELVGALVRGGALAMDANVVEATGSRTPGSLAAAIADRLEFLSTPVKSVLRGAALLGRDFSVAELAVVSGRRVNDLLPILDEAILAGVLRENGSDLAFRHPLIRAALYDAMPVAVRAAWHRDAARALAKDGAPAYRVARQLMPACEAYGGTDPVDEWIVRWLADTGHEVVGHAPDVAIPLLRWAMSGVPAGVAPHDVLACRLADALYRIGDPAGAADVATAALPHVRSSDRRIDLHWTLTQCRAVEGRSGESLAVLNRALDAPGVLPAERARLLVLTARVHRSIGRVDAAGEVADKALAAAKAAGDRWATGWALSTLTIVHAMQGDAARSLPLFDEALAVSEGDPALADLRLLLQVNQAVTLGDLDRYEDAMVVVEKVRQLADDAGNVVRLAQAQSALVELLFDLGRWDDALAEAEFVFGASKEPAVGCCGHGIAAAIHLHRGDECARAHLAEGERYARRLGDRNIGPFALAKSLEREQADAPAEALAVLMTGLSESAEEMEEAGDLLADAVRLALVVGDRGTAVELVRRAEVMARASDVPHWQAVATHCRGLLDHDPEPLYRAAERYEAAGRLLPRAQALEAAGIALADRGDIAGARTRFTEAFVRYETLGASWDLARTQAAFRAHGIRRGPRVRHRASHQGWDSLTPTELKVAALVAKGMSNPDIASRLFLSRRTVQTHVSHILAKLDLHSRIDIAREASRRELAQYGDAEAS